MRIELAIYRTERRLRKIADQQYWAERALIDASHHEPTAERVHALDEIYNDLLRRIGGIWTA